MGAIMIPRFIREEDFDPASREDIIFDSLEKNLPKNYYVFHSCKCSYVNERKYKFTIKKINMDAEMDFLILNTDKNNPGIIIIEAKYIDGIKINDGIWSDLKGNKIHFGRGPYEQVTTNVNFVKKFFGVKMPDLCGCLPITYIVWFHKMSNAKRTELKNISDMEGKHTFFMEDLINPYDKIEALLKDQAIRKDFNNNNLTDYQLKQIFRLMNIENDVFDIHSNINSLEKEFHRLLGEQVRVLDFLEEQNIACIQGLGGTGKTVVAIKKAQKCSIDGKTLFLCYNSALRDHLIENNKDYDFDIKTLDEFANKICKDKLIKTVSYSILTDYILSDNFEYKHVIIDEGQDFARDQGQNVNNLKIINDIFDAFAINADVKNGSFYIFFDRYQCVQSSFDLLPNVILHPDCLLTLHTNCRNTKEISYTSLKPLESCYNLNIKHKINRGISGDLPEMILTNGNDFEVKLNKTIIDLINKTFKDIVILTISTLEKSIINKTKTFNNINSKGLYLVSSDGKNYHIPVSTVRKFKGLEADCIILIDVTENTFKRNVNNHENIDLMNFYVGASRAKFKLSIISNINNNLLSNILYSDYKIADSNKSLRELKKILNVDLK